MSAKKYPGMLFRCEDHLAPEVRLKAAETLAAHQLFPAMNLTGMAADRLVEPSRPLPQLEFRQVRGRDEARDMIDIKCAKATGLSRTVLHATDAGRPVYLRMGYPDTSKFVAYMRPGH